MTHVPLRPIGNPRASICDDATFAAHADAIATRERQLTERRDEVQCRLGSQVRRAGPQKGQANRSRERLEQLKDPGDRGLRGG